MGLPRFRQNLSHRKIIRGTSFLNPLYDPLTIMALIAWDVPALDSSTFLVSTIIPLGGQIFSQASRKNDLHPLPVK